MSEELTKRVAFLERETRRIAYIIDQTEERTDTQMQAIAKNLQDFRKSVDERFECVDERFEHVDKQLADLTANTADIRNILASLVAKLEK
jgi:hypothetical protein